MLCTDERLDEIMTEVGRNDSLSIFSYEKDSEAYKLSMMENNRKRGHVVERIVMDVLIAHNRRVRYFGGRHPFDMLVNGSRVEVKSSMARVRVINGRKYYKYAFQNVKTKNFDKLILVFIAPEGLSIRQMTCATVEKYLANATAYGSGKTLNVQRLIRKNTYPKVCLA